MSKKTKGTKSKKKTKDEVPEVFEVGRLLKLRFSMWEGRKKVDKDRVECKPGEDGTVADAEMWDARKSVIDREKAILPIKRIKNQVISYVESQMVPGWDDRASFFITKDRILAIEAYLQEREKEFRFAVEELHKNMEEYKAEARVRLGPLWDPTDVPEDVRDHFKMRWNWLKVSPGNGDDVLTPEMKAQEITKFKDMMTDFRETAMFNLRLSFREVVHEIVDGLTGGSEDGKRKVVRSDFVESRIEKIKNLSSLNVFQDGELEEEIEKLRRALKGVDVEGLKEDEKYRDGIRKEVLQIVKEVKPWIADAPTRRIIRPSKLKHLKKR